MPDEPAKKRWRLRRDTPPSLAEPAPGDARPGDGQPAQAEPAPAAADGATRDLLRSMKKQQRLHFEQKLAEARELELRAKGMAKRIRGQQKLRADAARHADYVRSVAQQLGLDPSRTITAVPDVSQHAQQVEFGPVLEGRSFVRIVFDQQSNRYLYEAIEPALTGTEREVLDFIRDTLIRTLDGRQAQDQDWESYLADAVERVIVDHSILVDEVSKQRIQYYLNRDFLGYGPIDVLMRDPMIEDISCDGSGIPVYLFHRQYESIKTNVRFPEERGLDSFVIRLAQRSGKHISIAEPLLDATLPDTSRLQASLSREVTTRGSSFTIRKFRSDPLTPPDLVRLGTLTPEMAAFFWFAMQEGNSIIYAGGTASGKTTTLNAVSQFIPPQKKVVSIEDTREINLKHENWIAGLTRTGFGGELMANGKPAGSIDMYKLLEAALRQRPEYLIVGEVRGPEALTLFQAMATGHATYSTLHADSVQSAVYRLENPPINVPRLMLQTMDAMAIQVQVRIANRMVRRVKEVVEIVGVDPETGDLLTNTVFQWDPRLDAQHYLGKSKMLERIMEKNNLSAEDIEREWAQRTEVLRWMVAKGIRRIDDVASIVSAYYSTPDAILQRVREEPIARAEAPKARAPEGSP
ncbi:MAG: type II/IV secretion system ATPase subunit [Halobacteriales archaeon]|nr:type II/IV secretion system ATPase subunit [Halobacteriales archaeon]